MKRFVRAASAVALAAGSAGLLGCTSTGTTGGSGDHAVGDGAILRTFYDPCYPERYNATARAETLSAFSSQVNNAQILTQTIWNWYFEPGSDKLTPAGLAKLDSLAQTRPAPDPRIYLQAARDVQVLNADVEGVAARREDLTARRAAAVRKYMASQPAVYPVAYEVYVHDPAVVGMPGEFAAQAFRGQRVGYSGSIKGQAGTPTISTGGGGQLLINTGSGGAASGSSAGGVGPNGPNSPSGPNGP